MNPDEKKQLEDIGKRVEDIEDLLKSIRLPSSWFFEFPVIFRSAKWSGESRFSERGTGSDYSLTTTQALLAFGAGTPQIVITTPGVYLLFARVRLDYNGATFSSNRTISLAIARTNNTPDEIVDMSAKVRVVTTDSSTAGVYMLPVTIYETANKDDALEIQGRISTLPSAGSLDAVEAELTAVRIL